MGTIRIVIQLHTIAQKWNENGRIDKINLEINEGCTILEVTNQIEIPLKWEDLLVVVNQKIVTENYQPHDGDVIHIIPAISGG